MDIKKTNEIINELYNNENVSIGVHGTSILPDKKKERASDICKNGLICRYTDLRRTVNFQDRGFIHAHGNIQLDAILNYDYKKHTTGYINVTQKEGNVSTDIPQEVDLEQCTFLVSIPKEINTTDSELFGEKKSYKRDYATSLDNLRIGEKLTGKPLFPKYIVGYFYNGDLSNFIPNESFYGFKPFSKDTEFPTLDLENIAKTNDEVKKRNEQKDIISTQALGKETLEEQKDTKSKKMFSSFFKRIMEQFKNKSQEHEI